MRSASADCPRCADLRTPSPVGYLEWREWAAEKSKTHRQEQCPECGLWSVWKPKKPADAMIAADHQPKERP